MFKNKHDKYLIGAGYEWEIYVGASEADGFQSYLDSLPSTSKHNMVKSDLLQLYLQVTYINVPIIHSHKSKRLFISMTFIILTVEH